MEQEATPGNTVAKMLGLTQKLGTGKFDSAKMGGVQGPDRSKREGMSPENLTEAAGRVIDRSEEIDTETIA